MEQKLVTMGESDIAKLITALSKLNNAVINIYINPRIENSIIGDGSKMNCIIGDSNKNCSIILNGYGNI